MIVYAYLSVTVYLVVITLQAHRERGGGAGGPSAPNNLQNFADFLSEKAVKAKDVRKKIKIFKYSRKLPESIKSARCSDVIRVKKFKIFIDRLSLVVILCFRH